MAAGGGGGTGPGAGPGGGPGARRGSAGRDAEAEVWCRRVRELVSSVPANRLCFECGQRGVTYVDISVGSLVCTGCSGALRGLNPPHRVKSISMTTFSEAEVLFLQAHGNEACRRVWLGTFDPRTSLLPDSRDPQKVKEFLQEKYEKKRWYVAPEQVKEQVKPPQSTAAEPGPPQPLPGDTGTLPQAQPALPSPVSMPLEPALEQPRLAELCPPSTSPPAPQGVFGGSRNFGNPTWLLSYTCSRCGCPGRGHPCSAHRGRSFCQATPTPSWPPWPPDPPPTPSRATASVLLSPHPLFLGASPAPSRPMGCLSLGSTLPKLPPTPS
ncbi:arf-GAP domain and FG repeat-containing protein 2 isoform X9 [Haemorhous mexicanus]|uniref:arf-GAP domain and FG repeat-containing protein 2 isoform X9 n=1 Tax=Haemorhous mexicanus TaxID=30427 RepID=UPI0028BF1328|nr:arf-GAP domain and FG repeat-containing protein 2 isoform X9 [Haemorhous mexicanus]